MQVYLVGGAVRDELLGLPVTERDWVVVGATREELERLGYRAVGRDFPERRRRFRCRFYFRKSETSAMVFLSSSGLPRSWSAGRDLV